MKKFSKFLVVMVMAIFLVTPSMAVSNEINVNKAKLNEKSFSTFGNQKGLTLQELLDAGYLKNFHGTLGNIDKKAPTIKVTPNGGTVKLGTIMEVIATDETAMGEISITGSHSITLEGPNGMNLSSGGPFVMEPIKANGEKTLKTTFNFNKSGSYSITIKAKDAAGNERTVTKSFTVKTNVDTKAPTIKVTPKGGSIMSGKEVKIVATDDIAMESLNFGLSRKIVGTDSLGREVIAGGAIIIPNNSVIDGKTAIASFKMPAGLVGKVTLTITAKDAAGNVTNLSQEFTVNNLNITRLHSISEPIPVPKPIKPVLVTK